MERRGAEGDERGAGRPDSVGPASSTEAPSDRGPGAGLLLLAKPIVEVALRSHQRFEAERWQPNEDARLALGERQESPSYHNDGHIRSVMACSRHLFARAAEGRDPFGLSHQARLWNEAHPEASVDLDSLAFATHVAFACHDLGNITSSPDLVPSDGDGRSAEDSGLATRGTAPSAPRLSLAARYDSSTLYAIPAVEERSAAICERLLDRYVGDGELSRRVRPLASHLILQTVFHFDKVSSSEPFWLFMQTVDMVGSYYFSPIPRIRSVAGLFNEMRLQKDGSIRVVPFLTSLKERYEKLLPDEAAREDALRLFEENACGQSRETVFAGAGPFAAYTQPLPFREAIGLLLSQAPPVPAGA